MSEQNEQFDDEDVSHELIQLCETYDSKHKMGLMPAVSRMIGSSNNDEKPELGFMISLDEGNTDKTVTLVVLRDNLDSLTNARNGFPGLENWPPQKRIQVKTTTYEGDLPNRKSSTVLSNPSEVDIQKAKAAMQEKAN